MPLRRARQLILACLLVIASAVHVNAAAPTTEAIAQAADANSAGIKAMRAKKHDEALAHFQRAYSLDPNHKILWNLARVHELTAKKLETDGKPDEARTRLEQAEVGFQLLVKDPETPDKVVALATTKLKAVQTRIAALDVAPKPDPKVIKPPPPHLTQRPEAVSYQTEAIITLTVGAVTAGVGTYFLLDAGSTRSTVADATDANGFVSSMTQRQAAVLQDEANTAETIGVVSMILGGALIATGIVFFAIEPDSDEGTASTSVVVAPALLPSGVMLSTQGRF